MTFTWAVILACIVLAGITAAAWYQWPQREHPRDCPCQDCARKRYRAVFRQVRDEERRRPGGWP